MATKDEALKMAIEALEDADTIITQRCRVLLDAIQPAINACKEALEQQTDCNHDWVSAKNKIVQNGSVCMKCHAISALELNELKALEQPAQEPVNNCPNCGSWFTKEIHSIPAPLWQELTDDEITELHHNWITNSDTMYFARAIEQALRNKNAL